MVFWEAGKLASILRHSGDNINLGYSNPLQNLPRNENISNINKTGLGILDFYHSDWLNGARLSAHIPAMTKCGQ